MKKWGLLVTLLYALFILAIVTPASVVLTESRPWRLYDFENVYRDWGLWLVLGIVLAGEIVLLSLSVDTTWRRLRPRTSIAITAFVASFFLLFITVLTGAAFFLGIWGEGAVPSEVRPIVTVSAFLVPWLVWGLLFYRLYRNSSDPVTGAVKWLLRGSVLELLIAVPAHVMVRRRHECCAPDITAFGITTGIAIMFLSFGPSVLLLLKKRMDMHKTKEPVSV